MNQFAAYLLRIGGYFNIMIAIAHIIGLLWADQMFEALGFGKEMQALNDMHSSYPYLLTLFVAIVFFMFGLYGLSAGGEIGFLPLKELVIYSAAAFYLARGLGSILYHYVQESFTTTEIVFSSIANTIGLFFLVGGLIKWKRGNLKAEPLQKTEKREPQKRK